MYEKQKMVSVMKFGWFKKTCKIIFEILGGGKVAQMSKFIKLFWVSFLVDVAKSQT